jgi:tetratricopeptide (TPR) repeat protein
MTSPNAPTRPRHVADDESITEWMMLHKRQVTWAVVAVAVLAGGAWYYQRSQALRAQRAEAQYFQARQAGAAGNLPLAVSDLQKVATRYEGTQAGAQAALTLAQTLYDQKKYKEGVSALQKVEGKVPDDFKPSVHTLEAAGYEQLKDFVNAAEQYKSAALASRFPADKSQYKASAARDYMAAGKTAEAASIWTEIAKEDTGPMASEAKVRLGEVLAKPMKI